MARDPQPSDKINETAERYFNDTLKRLALDEASVKTQTLEELNDSLERVNDALRYPDFAGFETKSSMGLIIGGAEVTAKLSIGPLLLESKRLIQERIRLLKSASVSAESASSPSIRANFRTDRQKHTQTDRIRRDIAANLWWLSQSESDDQMTNIQSENRALAVQLINFL